MSDFRRDLSRFSGEGYDIGRGRLWQVAWLVVSTTFLMRWWVPLQVRASILRFFGAEIGNKVRIRHRVRIHWPWKLSVGDHTWIGEGVWILNLEPVTIGRDVCISQDVFLCTGSHDRRSPTFEFDNGPIVVEDDAWVAARATILRGVTVGVGATVGAAALVSSDVDARTTVLAPRAGGGVHA